MTLDSKKEFLTSQELADRWRVHLDSIHRWRREGKPPSFYSINGKILYKLAEIEDLELAKRQSNN
jgi:predicted site-specific integrase-resolvase